MVNAVKHLHLQKVCHRDLKLENFMMEKEGSWEIRVIDFGLSFIWNKSMREELATKEEKKLIGTTYYMSPEVLSYSYDERCDIWSLGVILYMMVTGAPPFDGDKEIEIIENIKKINYSLNSKALIIKFHNFSASAQCFLTLFPGCLNLRNGEYH
jgi:serine/threonine protein kinase